MTITLYSGPISYFARKAEIALGEKGLEFERIMVPFSQAKGYQPKHPNVLAANPKAQVPVLVDGDLTMFDSTLIFEYLEDAYPVPPLLPSEPKDRARCRMLELLGDEILLPAVRPIMHRSVPPTDPETRRKDEEAGRRGELVLLEHYQALEGRIGDTDYLCGAYSIADIGIFMALTFSLRLKGPRLDGHPKLAAWYARVGARPAVAKVKADLLAADRVLSPTLYS
jgi:glutathione S-transferase